jgi:hypothetical protein
MQNGDLIVVPNGVLPSVGLYDGASSVLSQCIVVIPFIFARQILTSPQSNEQILRYLSVTGLLLSLPMLFEIRMSPQLQGYIYGFIPGEFYQQARGETFRPILFMGHGIAVAFFAMTCAVASCTLWRAHGLVRGVNAGRITGYLAAVLALCQSFGATAYAAFLLPVIRLIRPKRQLSIAKLLVIIALAYPALRFLDLVPTETILSAVSSISTDRAASLQTRFDNERNLLDRALERPWFGWGRFARSRVFNEANGLDNSITDGRWIITTGQYGLVGFLAEFGLLAISVFRASAALKYLQSEPDRIFLAGLTLIVAINLVELLPNSNLLPWTWLLAGALIARAESLRTGARRNDMKKATQPSQSSDELSSVLQTRSK